ncbi:MAG TPA: prolyl oligopeptidase family serine peptidase [Vicinamibacterales bacterium]|nr:prolyl oligopeptidase family serine peptidase [Vicinamibacterales bacterium]
MPALQRTWLLVLLTAATVMAQAPAPAPKLFPPTAEQRVQIDAKLADLTKRIDALAAKKTDPQLLADVAIYQKAAQFILRYPEEFSTASYTPETIAALDAGLARAAELEAGKSSWSRKTGNVVRAYVSRIDGSVQPYGLTIPASYDGTRPTRLDVWLHGTSVPLNEVRFIAQQSKPHADGNAPEPTDFIQMEPLGRMNQSYRYSGETDVFEAIASVQKRYNIDPKRILIRGHSMGGQAWHLGLQHPGFFAALEASAGYTDTHEYAAARLPKEGLPAYQEATLHYYDSQDYAMNAFNIIAVGHGGEDDPQLRASQRIREALTKDGFSFTQETPYRWTTKDLPAVLFLVSPKTGHLWLPDVKAESEAFLRKALATAGAPQPRVRCVTYTARWNDCDWVSMNALGETYQRAEVDATRSGDLKKVTATTKNLSQLGFTGPAAAYTLDGQALTAGADPTFDKVNGKWSAAATSTALRKTHGLQGPIDDAFVDSFVAVRGTGQPWNAGAQQYAQKRFDMLKFDFAKWMRGDIRVKDDTAVTAADIASANLILFGDPGSNSLIARILDRLPIQWTKTDITVGARKFTAADNVPVLVYPNPLSPRHYVVINSGHTFNDDRNLAGSESMFFPRIGDYAVVHVDSAAMTGLTPVGDVKLSGFFDEGWKLK